MKSDLGGNKYITFAMKSKELIRLLMQNGWYIVRQPGSHIIMRHPDKTKQIVVLMHGNQDMAYGLLKRLLKDTGLL
ncbi:MAG: type II toxin-antitoxin system HicA family toxin [Bacteroidota bacterium]